MASIIIWFEAQQRRRLALLALLVLLAAVVRLFRIEHPVLWQDEIFTWVYTRETYAHHFALDRTTDVHPPLFTVALKAWISIFGESRAAMRTLPALFGALSVPVIYLIGRNWFGLSVAILACIVFAFHPLNVHYTREIRFYGAVAFAMLWASYFFLELIRQREMPARRMLLCSVGFSLSLALSFHLQYVSLLFIALFGITSVLLLIQNRDWRLFHHLAICIAVAVLLCVPQSVHFLGYAMHEGAVRNAWIAPTNLSVFIEQTQTAIGFPGWSAVGILGLYAFGLLRLRKRSPQLFTVMITFVVLGPLLFALVGFFKPIYLARSFLGALMLLPLLLAFAVTSLPRHARPVALLLLAIMHVWALRPDYPAHRLPNPGEAIAAAAPQWSGGTVYYDEQLEKEMAAYRIPASGWHLLNRRDVPGDLDAIARHLARCRAAAMSCGPTVLIFEARPPFDPALGRGWNGMVEPLSRISPVLSERAAAYYRFVVFR